MCVQNVYHSSGHIKASGLHNNSVKPGGVGDERKTQNCNALREVPLLASLPPSPELFPPGVPSLLPPAHTHNLLSGHKDHRATTYFEQWPELQKTP